MKKRSSIMVEILWSVSSLYIICYLLREVAQ